MAEFIIDLSGRGGLGDGFSGDIDRVTPQPELRIDDGTGLASGNFNPFLRNGYLAPTTTTTVAYTADVAPVVQFNSFVDDVVNGKTYWAEKGESIYRADGLSDTSLTQVLDLGTGKEIQDLEIYKIQDKRQLFYVYSNTSTVDTINLERSAYWITTSIEVNPVATTKPTIIYSLTDKSLSSTTTITTTVPAGSNIGCTVISTLGAISGITVGGTAMNLVNSSSYSYASESYTCAVWSLGNTGSGSKTIVITGTAGAFSIIFTDNTATSTPVTFTGGKTGMSANTVSTGTYSDTKLSLSFLVVNSAVGELVGTPTITTYDETAQTGSYGHGLAIGNSGTKMYLSGSSAATLVYQYSLGTAYQISSGVTYDSKTLNYSAQFPASGIGSIQFNPDGTKMYMISTDNSPANFAVKTWSLSTAWDISTATHASQTSPSAAFGGASFVSGFSFSSDGYHYYLSGSDSSEYPAFFQYTLGTAWDVSTAVYATKLRMHDIMSVPNYNIFAGPGCTANNDSQFIFQYEVTGDTFYSLDFDPLYPRDVSKCTLSTASTGEINTVTVASNSPYGQHSYAGGYLFYRNKNNNDVTRLSFSPKVLPGVTITSNTIGYTKHQYDSFWGTSSYIAIRKTVDCGIMNLTNNAVYDSDWLSDVADLNVQSRADYNFIRSADNGFSYLFTQDSVHSIDGGTTGGIAGTVTKNVLLFPSHFTITDAIDYRSMMYIAMQQYLPSSSIQNYRGAVGIYVWNRVSTRLSAADFIELPGVREIKKIYASPDGMIKLITLSDNGTAELREFGYNDSGGVVFPVKKRLGIGAFPQVPDGLSTAGDKVTWLANDGTIYAEKGNAVVKLFQAKAPGTGTTGVAQNITSGALLYGSGVETSADDGTRTNKQGISFSYKDGSSYYTKKIYPFDIKTGSDGSQTPHQGDVYSQVKLIPQGSAVRNIRIYNAPVSSTGTTVIATVKVYFNQSTTASMPSGMTKSITLNEAKRGYVDFHINKQYIHAVQIEVEWATGTPIGVDMYLPSVAVITYDELKTQSPDNG